MEGKRYNTIPEIGTNGILSNCKRFFYRGQRKLGMRLIINTLLCIGIFTDNHAIFNTAAERYYRGPGNSGITKYIYPNGQIQETTRDWDHVQLGIGEFAKAAQVAWTQGLDLYGATNKPAGV